jgi:hypothetical protein
LLYSQLHEIWSVWSCNYSQHARAFFASAAFSSLGLSAATLSALWIVGCCCTSAKSSWVEESWTPFEREGLAISWLKASKDPRTGAYRDSADFWKAVVHAFHERGPRGTLGHCKRSVKACKNIFLGDISPDVQKFTAALRRIIASEPTGVTIENFVPMSIAVHKGLTARMECK